MAHCAPYAVIRTSDVMEIHFSARLATAKRRFRKGRNGEKGLAGQVSQSTNDPSGTAATGGSRTTIKR
jgi:hypothetical protein